MSFAALFHRLVALVWTFCYKIYLVSENRKTDCVNNFSVFAFFSLFLFHTLPSANNELFSINLNVIIISDSLAVFKPFFFVIVLFCFNFCVICMERRNINWLMHIYTIYRKFISWIVLKQFESDFTVISFQMVTFVRPNPLRSTLAELSVDGVTLVCNLRMPLLRTISSHGNSVAFG